MLKRTHSGELSISRLTTYIGKAYIHVYIYTYIYVYVCMYACMYVCIREICGVFDINDTPKILGNEPIWKHFTCWVIYINFGIRRTQKKLVHHEPSRRRVISKTFLVYLYIYVRKKSMVYSISKTLLKYLETNPFESILPAGLFILIYITSRAGGEWFLNVSCVPPTSCVGYYVGKPMGGVVHK